LPFFHRENEGVGELFDGGPIVFGIDGNDYVEAFASGAFEETFEVYFFELLADFESGVGEGAPRDCGVGVEVDDDAVGVLEVSVG
jgi:hypothetical protein